MAIVDARFECEQELHDWAAANICNFLPDAEFLSGFQVATTSGKKGVPDGFAFNFKNREWFVIESELLSHGVWPHIAEQLVRFVVALQNPQTRRKVRDRVFEHLVSSGRVEQVSESLETSCERLLQQLEIFIEGIEPQVVVFIDDTNKDLDDMTQALSSVVQVFRIQKFVANGVVEYYSPDGNVPALVSEGGSASVNLDSDYDIVSFLGGGSIESTHGRFKCYRLSDGNVVHVKRSKFHERGGYYWYGINASTLVHLSGQTVSHVVFVMGGEGCVMVPLDTVVEFLKHSKTSLNADGSIRHHHLLISPAPEPELYWSNDTPRYSLSEHYRSF